ncbi:MAG: acyl-CoA thioesterase [Polyangiaceae bacterium]|nr:acyl-CoA thioesterase [Polyangiaceae bacterium]
MIPYERPIRFEDVDAARIVFFARFLNYAHEAMEHFFGGLEGGYGRLIATREIGLPAVEVNVQFLNPVKYPDTLRIETTTARLGNRSATLRYRMYRRSDGEKVAQVKHTVVTTNLLQMRSVEMPDDVRAILSEHIEL